MNTVETYFKWLHACLWYKPVEEEETEDISYEIKNAECITAVPVKAKSYFTIEEMTASATAKKLKIDNTPPDDIKKNLQKTIAFLNPLREAWGSAIRVSSGYRCQELNKAVKGSTTSMHPKGYAADLIPANGKMKDFKKFIQEYLKDKNFDQCITERSGSTEWIHIGLYNNAHQQRKQIKNIVI